MENDEFFPVIAFEPDRADARAFPQFILDPDPAGIASDALESAPELLGMPRLMDVVRAGDTEEREDHGESDEVSSHGL